MPSNQHPYNLILIGAGIGLLVVCNALRRPNPLPSHFGGNNHAQHSLIAQQL